jgi:hypothetical protein
MSFLLHQGRRSRRHWSRAERTNLRQLCYPHTGHLFPRSRTCHQRNQRLNDDRNPSAKPTRPRTHLRNLQTTARFYLITSDYRDGWNTVGTQPHGHGRPLQVPRRRHLPPLRGSRTASTVTAVSAAPMKRQHSANLQFSDHHGQARGPIRVHTFWWHVASHGGRAGRHTFETFKLISLSRRRFGLGKPLAPGAHPSQTCTQPRQLRAPGRRGATALVRPSTPPPARPGWSPSLRASEEGRARTH